MRELEFDEEMMDTAMEWSKNYVKKFNYTVYFHKNIMNLKVEQIIYLK